MVTYFSKGASTAVGTAVPEKKRTRAYDNFMSQAVGKLCEADPKTVKSEHAKVARQQWHALSEDEKKAYTKR